MRLIDRARCGARTKAGQITIVVCVAAVFLSILFPPLESPGRGMARITRRELETPIWSDELHYENYPFLPSPVDPSPVDPGGSSVLRIRPQGERDFSQDPEVDYFYDVDGGRLVVEWVILGVLFVVGMSVVGIVVSPVDGDKESS